MNKDIEAEVERIWRAAGNGRDMIREGMKFAYADAAKVCKGIGKAHTYASENADRYIGFDDGVDRCIMLIERRVKEG